MLLVIRTPITRHLYCAERPRAFRGVPRLAGGGSVSSPRQTPWAARCSRKSLPFVGPSLARVPRSRRRVSEAEHSVRRRVATSLALLRKFLARCESRGGSRRGSGVVAQL